MAQQPTTEGVLRRRIGVLRADLAGASARVRALEAVLAQRDDEGSFLRTWAEGAEQHARSELAARMAGEREVVRLRAEIDQLRGELAGVLHSLPVRLTRLLTRVVRPRR